MILAATGPIWPFVTAVAAALIGFAGSVYAVVVQRKTEKLRTQDAAKADENRKEEDALKASVSAQVTLTKDVLDNWKGIVTNLGKQITDLHNQVVRLEDREHKCQIELLDQKRRLLELEGRVSKEGRI